MLWDGFTATWPLLQTPDMKQFPGASAVIDPWHLPLVNTVLLITSSVTVTFAHHALKEQKRGSLEAWLAATIVLAVVFLYFQAIEYHEAYLVGFDASFRYLWSDVFYADRFPWIPRDARHDDVVRDVAPLF